MPLGDQLAKTLSDLNAHCEALQAQLEAVQTENAALKAQLSALQEKEKNNSDKEAIAALEQMFAQAGLGEQVSYDAFQRAIRLPAIEHKLTTMGVSTQDAEETFRQLDMEDEEVIGMKEILSSLSKIKAAQPQTGTASLATEQMASVVPAEEQQLPGCVRPAVSEEGEQKAAAKSAEVINPFAANRKIKEAAKKDPRRESALVSEQKMDTLTGELVGQDEIQKVHNMDDFIEAFTHVDEDLGPLAKIVESLPFKGVCMVAIAANTVYLGASADLQVKQSWQKVIGGHVEEDDETMDLVFCAWFTFEILIKLAASGKQFFIGEDGYWNLFDTVLVAESIVSVTLQTGRSISFLRILRVFRLVRVVRLVRTVKPLRKLRTMIYSIMNCFIDLLWSFIMIFLIIYLFAIVFDNAVATYFHGVATNGTPEDLAFAGEVQVTFGSLFETMLSLWCAISGGNDWYFYAEILRGLDDVWGEFYLMVFLFYIAFCVIGLLNVVTGIFVDSAVCTRSEDEVVEGYTEDLRSTTEDVRRIFGEADTDRSGTICYEELRKLLENHRVKAYFAGLNIDPSEAKTIFTLIDTSGNGEVSFEEFVNGTMKLKGHAKSLDVVALMYDAAKQAQKHSKFQKYVENKFDELVTYVRPQYPPIGSRFSPVTPAPRTSREQALRFDRTSDFNNSDMRDLE